VADLKRGGGRGEVHSKKGTEDVQIESEHCIIERVGVEHQHVVGGYSWGGVVERV